MSRPALSIEYPLSPEQAIGAGRLTTAASARAWADGLLRPHGLETLPPGLGGPDDADNLGWGTIPNPKGWTLVLSPVAERTRDAVGDEPLAPLPDGTRLEALGWEVDGDAWHTPPEDAHEHVLGVDVPPVARALVNAWWSEESARGLIRRPHVPTVEGSVGWVQHDHALEYADTLERIARELRETVERGRLEDQTRRGDYSAALRLIADGMSGDAAVATARVADIIGSGKGRLAAAVEVGLDREAWALTTKPDAEPDGEG